LAGGQLRGKKNSLIVLRVARMIIKLIKENFMRKLTLALFASAALLSGAISAQAQELLETYVARIGPNDHFNTRGVRLKSFAAVIRQDRANFHKFGRRDAEDEHDTFFSSKANRARMERMLKNGTSSGSARRRIINNQPMIRVEIYRNFVNVTVF
jgi:hypothetical protein